MRSDNPLDRLVSRHQDSGWRRDDYCREDRPCRPVRELVIRGRVGVIFLPATSPQLEVAGVDQQAIDRVQTDFSGDRLTVGQQGGGINIAASNQVNINIQGNGNVVIGENFISVGNVSINAGGAADCIVALAQPEAPRIKLQGAGDATLYDIDQASLDLSLQGSGDIVTFGQVEHLEARVAGSGDVDATALSARAADLTVSGSGDIASQVVERVRARVNGSGDILVYGDPPDRQTRVPGSGAIRFT